MEIKRFFQTAKLARSGHQKKNARSEFMTWRERGQYARAYPSWIISVSGLLAAGIVLLQLFDERPIARAENSEDGIVGAQHSAVRRRLLEERLREIRALNEDEEQRRRMFNNYVNAVAEAMVLARETGIRFVSDDLLTAIADAILAGGMPGDISRILASTKGDARVVALSHYYVLIRAGERPELAVNQALRYSDM